MPTRGQRLAWLTLLLAAGFGALLWISFRRAGLPVADVPSEGQLGASGPDSRSATDAQLEPALRPAGLADDAAPPLAGQRAQPDAAQPTSAISGRVLRADGIPLIGARVQWTPLESRLEHEWPLGVPWDEVRAASRITVTDADGRFFLEAPVPESDLRASIVWASTAGVEPSVAVLAAVDGRWAMDPVSQDELPDVRARDLELRCSVLAAQVVRVRGATGEIAQGATVRMLGQSRVLDVARYGDVLARARRLYFFDAAVDDDGIARLPAFAIPVLYQAVRGAELSDARRGTPRESLELVLAGSVEFECQVVLASDAVIGPRDAITVARQNLDGTWSWIGGFRLREDGSCGPHGVADLPALEWQFLLQAERLLTDETRVPPWRSGERARIQLAGVRAQSLRVRAVAAATGEPLVHAAVQARWARTGTNSEVTYGKTVLTSDAGWVDVGAPGATPLWVSVSCPGYGDVDLGPLVAGDGPVEARLVPQSTLRGRVRHAGTPVTSFRVTSWTTDRLRCSYRDFTSEDGSFVLEQVPQEVVTLYAVGGGFGQCPPTQIDLRGKSAGEIELELPASVRGRGRIVDANSRDPLADVVVQLYTSEQYQMLTPSGVETRTAPDGSFELDGFPPSYSSIYCLKDGYSPQYAFALGKEGEEIEFGLVSMTPDAPYCMQLLPSPWPGLTVTSWQATGASTADGIVPDGAGFSCVRGVKPGLLEAKLRYSDGSTVRFDHPVMPGPAFDWKHTIGGPAQLTIEIRGADAPPCAHRPPYQLALDYATPEGVRAKRRFELGDGLSQRLDGLVVGPQLLTIFDRSACIARRSITVDGSHEQRIVVDAECSRRCLRILDQVGEPYAQKLIEWCREGEHYLSKEVLRTDANGEFCMLGSVTGTIEITATESGFVVSQPVLLNAGTDDVQVVRLGGLGDVCVRLVENGVPLAGIVCMLQNENPFFLQNMTSTNDQGVARWERISQSMQRLHLCGQGLWNQSLLLAPQPAPAAPRDVQVYRIGELELRAIDSTGLSIQAARFELVHDELGESASAWLAAGRIKSSTDSMSSDPSGLLRVSGLPRGRYLVTVDLANGLHAEGACEVVSGDLRRCTVTIQ